MYCTLAGLCLAWKQGVSLACSYARTSLAQSKGKMVKHRQLQGRLAGNILRLSSGLSVCLSARGAACSHLQHGRSLAVLPWCSWTGEASAQLSGNEKQRPCPSWKLEVDEESSSHLVFCDLPCLGTCCMPGCATWRRAQTPSLHAAKAAEKAHAPHAVVIRDVMAPSSGWGMEIPHLDHPNTL